MCDVITSGGGGSLSQLRWDTAHIIASLALFDNTKPLAIELPGHPGMALTYSDDDFSIVQLAPFTTGPSTRLD